MCMKKTNLFRVHIVPQNPIAQDVTELLVKIEHLDYLIKIILNKNCDKMLMTRSLTQFHYSKFLVFFSAKRIWLKSVIDYVPMWKGVDTGNYNIGTDLNSQMYDKV